jgi:putative flavoprotein involved in K+ transport
LYRFLGPGEKEVKKMKHVNVMIIGGGQVGLSASYVCQQKGISHRVLDAEARIGDSWRKRYDSLSLFTPQRYSTLFDFSYPFSLENNTPTKDEFADYLEAFAVSFSLPVSLHTEVYEVKKEKDSFILSTSQGKYSADFVIVASGGFQVPFFPETATHIPHSILSVHSSQYKNRSQIKGKRVAVIGGGNSGMQIAKELSKDYHVTLSTSDKPWFIPPIFLGKSIFYWFEIFGILHAKRDSFIGKRLRKRKDPIFDNEAKVLIEKQHIELKPRLISFENGELRFQDDSRTQADTIIWCTGFDHDFSWINVPDRDPNLFFLGLPWLRAKSSSLICGAEREAKEVVNQMMES